MFAGAKAATAARGAAVTEDKAAAPVTEGKAAVTEGKVAAATRKRPAADSDAERPEYTRFRDARLHPLSIMAGVPGDILLNSSRRGPATR